MRSKLMVLWMVFGVVFLVGCATPQQTSSAIHAGAKPVDVSIRWTSFGIPHVKADDWRSLGYGFAYATATDGVCVIAKDVVTVNGNLMKFFGERFRTSDVFHRALITDTRLMEFSKAQSDRAKEFSAGYVAGYNRYLKDNKDQLPASCAGKDWVRPISDADVTRLTLGVGIRYGLGRYTGDIAAAQPPADDAQTTAFAIKPPYQFEDQPIDSPLASNAVAFGSAVTENGRGLLFGNPHYPWSGPSRFHLIHMTLPGEIDVMGASLLTTAGVSVGFNKDIAWSHTVSTGMRATLYKLELDPKDPTRYRYGDEFRQMSTQEVTLGLSEEGKPVTAIVYFSHYGPIVEREGLPWNNQVAYAVRDANLENYNAAETYDAIGKATSVDDIVKALNLGGVSWVNTVAADKDGQALYADISTVPNVTTELVESCKLGDAQVGRAKMIVLDGARPDCEWIESTQAKVAGAMPTEEMPMMIRDDYVSNSNDSYWLTNPNQPLEGYSPIIGPEKTARTIRTRAGIKFVEELLKAGPISIETATSLISSHRNFGAELLLDDLLTLCVPENESIAEACKALANWDRTHNIESRGAHVWSEIMRSLLGDSSIYRVPFDLTDPVNTPNGLKVEDKATAEKLIGVIKAVQNTIATAGIELDAKLGDIQYAERNGKKIPVPGGEGWAGAYSMIVTQLSKVKGVGYSPIIHGNSIIQFTTWDDDGKLLPKGLLTYSQSQEPDSPHYSDQTELYAKGEWIDFPFYEQDIVSDPNLRELRLKE
ncbi:MAG: penicillin acylase family protein [Gammaproteobacteria bacterium]|nr:penicillin acylase family protein [Gammaproteobacteria bacterium]